jgi:hypothetical protein
MWEPDLKAWVGIEKFVSSSGPNSRLSSEPVLCLKQTANI